MNRSAVVRLELFVVCLKIVWAANSYNVAVIEYAVNINFSGSADDILENNTRNYLNLIHDVINNQHEPLDLIIFPESTFTPYFYKLEAAIRLPTSKDKILCNSTDDIHTSFLRNFSCAAIQYNTTIIINLTEREFCQHDENDYSEFNEVFYNTNIALGSNGSIIARYRKWNLFGEYGKSKPTTLDLPIFEIKNTTFGMMTCFDVQFNIPGFNLTKQKGVRNIIFPLNWISELPYLTALQMEQMWAEEHDVVLLASGANLPQSGASGSGIFYGKQGALNSFISSQSDTKVIVHSIPPNLNQQINITTEDNSVKYIDALGASMDDFFMLVDPSMAEHNSVVLDTTESVVKSTVCHGKQSNILCCEFDISTSSDRNSSINGSFEAYTYHLVAFNGIRTYSGLYYGGVETCGLVACLNNSVASCGQRFQNYSDIAWPITFHSISIKGNFTSSDQRVQYPTTLLSSIRPLPTQDYSWNKENTNNTIFRQLTLDNPHARLMTFGIFGRDFERDWDPIRNNTLKGNNSNNNNGVELPVSISLVTINLVVFLFVFLLKF